MELAVGASEATIKSLLTKLGGLLSEEYSLIRGVRGDIQFINDELASMQAFLSNLSSSADDQDDQTKDWMKQVRDVSYDIEDCIDDFAHGLRPDSRRDGWLSKVRRTLYELRTWYVRRTIAVQIGELKERAQHVGQRRERYGVRDPKIGKKKSSLGGYLAAEHQQTTRRLIGIKELVGVKKDMEELEKWIISENKSPGVLSIFGFGGVGKTTAAMALYRKCGVQFKRRAMITVSHNTDPDVVLRDILRQVRTQVEDQQAQISTGSMTEKKKKNQTPPWQLARSWTWHRNQGDDGISSNKEHQALTKEPIDDPKNRLVNSTQVEDDQQRQISTESTSKRKNQAPSSTLGKLCQTRMWPRNQGKDVISSEHQALTKELRDHLGKNRYLLLFDDVWSSSMWQTICKCLPQNEECSRIIVTTRFEAVGTSLVGHHRFHHRFHKMDILSDKDAEDLFQKSLSECRVTQGSQASQQTDEIPSRVWEICGGLPLPILTMAGLVASTKQTEQQWNSVCQFLFPENHVCRKPEEFMRIIDYCYNVLPSDLKTCSLYLCIFPKGRKISRKRLIRRWIAEGFVSEKQGLSVEDVAETCFTQLVERKIIRAVEHSDNGRVKSCQVHDMVLEYIISKAGEENFVTVIGGQWSMPTGSNKVRRLSLHNSNSKHAEKADSMNLSHVRSLTVFGSLDNLRFKSFKTGIVQVLDLQGCKDFKENHVSVSDICEMTLLKYLSLRGTDISKLPPNIRNLKYLETLDVRETEIQQLPPAICHLERIRNILGGDKKKRTTLKLPKEVKGAMKELRILSGVEIVEGSTAASDIQMFTRLTKLAIYKLHKDAQMFKDLLSSIQYLSGYALQALVIDDESSDFLNTLDHMAAPPTFLSALELSGKLLKLPKWLPTLNELVKLTLSASALRTDNLVHLSKLSSLFSLTFSISAANRDPEMAAILEKNKSDSGGDISVPVTGFGKLKQLRIFVPLLPSLNFYNKSMRLLERLELRFKRLEGLHGMDKLASLHDVILTVDDRAVEPTQSILKDLKKSTSESQYALTINEYHD